ncbi:uncharacterized protein Dmul_04220 [Desulfococcus multivorans]|nr:uncharacterized protein Dmul_04220 [Desulfococcus multivorans]
MKSAQRLSASEIGAVKRAFEGEIEQLCSTPFGIGDRCGGGSVRLGVFRRVLNAFRHRRSVRELLNDGPPFGHLCSTPFGIGDRCGARSVCAVAIKARAQRLSASEIGAELGAFALWLSKPVLNAFRHRRSVRSPAPEPIRRPHKCSTPFGIGDRCGRRLLGLRKRSASAQRLSASEIGAESHRPGKYRATSVLNAFRHRRSVRFGSRSHCRRVSSAQRLSASEIGADGIHPGVVEGLRVLNAFRHRRSVRTTMTVVDPGSVTVLNAFRHRRSVRSLPYCFICLIKSAQRLSASEIGAGSETIFFARSSTCAQRLSASEIGAEDPLKRNNVLLRCSTPFGIGDRCGLCC